MVWGRERNTMNAAPSTTASALLNNAIDLGLEVVECSIGNGFIIVTGAAASVTEWMNEAPGFVTKSASVDGWLIGAREIRA